MSESEIRAELLKLLDAEQTARIMDMVSEYAREVSYGAASDAIQDYDER